MSFDEWPINWSLFFSIVPNMQITLFLMTAKGLSFLNTAIEVAPLAIKQVVGSRDPQVDEDYFEAIRDKCKEFQILFIERNDWVSNQTSELSIAISWRWLIPNPENLIILHDSLLPKYRGFNPLVTALINHDKKIGVTAIYANKEFDAGDIIFQESIDIEYPIKISTAIQLISTCYSKIAKKIMLAILQNGNLPRIPQNSNDVSYSVWRDEQDYRIIWSESAELIQRKVNALGFPYKGALTSADNIEYRIIDCSIIPDVAIANRDQGKALFIQDNKPLVICGTGLLRIDSAIDNNGLTIAKFPKARLRFH